MSETMQAMSGAGARAAEVKSTVSGKSVGNHNVQFYSEDSFLVATVSRFLASALEQGGAAIVVATQAHRVALVRSLRMKGLDLSNLRKLRRFRELDAEETLSEIMVEDWPDRERLTSLAAHIAEARASCEGEHGEVAAYGEMVNVLWGSGRMDAAMYLERLWNELLETHPVSVLCGYSVETFNQEAGAASLAQVCAQHRQVFPAEGYLQLKTEQDRLRYVVRLQRESETLKSEIHERKRAQAALVHAERGAAVGRLAATIAHEINNPLASLTNLLYLLQTQSPQDANIQHYASLADLELRRISRITKQMLGFYRDSPSPIGCKLSEVADGILELYESQIAKKGIFVDRTYASEGAIEGFPSELRQLFANLIGNAIEATGSEGKIRLRISRVRSRENTSAPGVRVTISDNGVGIPAANKHSIFEPFFTTKGESGTGLGLWVCQGIVQKHQGHIRFRSRTQPGPFRGTTLSIFLPVDGKLHKPLLPAA